METFALGFWLDSDSWVWVWPGDVKPSQYLTRSKIKPPDRVFDRGAFFFLGGLGRGETRAPDPVLMASTPRPPLVRGISNGATVLVACKMVLDVLDESRWDMWACFKKAQAFPRYCLGPSKISAFGQGSG